MIAIILEYNILSYVFVIVACTLSLGIGVFWLVISMTKNIEQMLRSINAKAQNIENQSNQLEILFSDYIHAHVTVKQLSIVSKN